MTQLEDLPAFQVLQITNADDPKLVGVFNHLKGVRAGRSWLYAGDADSLIGDLVDVDEATRQARFTAPFWSPSSPIQVGSVVPWLDGYWQAYHLTMILDPEAAWKRTEFTASHCELCQSKIGRGGDAHGYVDRNDRWLCGRCYHDYAEPRSLGFVFSV